MKDKRELLELAARACGYEVREPFRDGEFRVSDKDGLCFAWDPTDDDGDCARLEEKLTIDLTWNESDGLVWANLYSQEPVHEYYANHNGNKGAARRLASTRAAAEVGRGMK
jgi:hypothetical protein